MYTHVSHVFDFDFQQALVSVLLRMVIMVNVLWKVMFVHMFVCFGESNSTGSCLYSSLHGDHGECVVEGVVCTCVLMFGWLNINRLLFVFFSAW